MSHPSVRRHGTSGFDLSQAMSILGMQISWGTP